MNVASLELCKELYELSGEGWGHQEDDHTLQKWYVVEDVAKLMTESDWEDWAEDNGGVDVDGDFYPAYDLGYLLRKLPNVRVWQSTKNIWSAKGGTRDYETLGLGDTPEDAACKLLIELFKQGVLTKHP